MREAPKLPAAALLGAGGGMRTFAPPVALSRTITSSFTGRSQQLLLAAALGELIVDKLPMTPSRWSPFGVIPRIGFSGVGGLELAGPAGAGVAAAMAVLTAYTGARLRTSVQGRGRALLAALTEDALSYTLATIAIRST